MKETNETPQASENAGSSDQPEQAAGAEGSESAQEAPAAEEVSKDARTWAMLCHLLGLFTCFVAPLIIWLIKKDEDSFIDNQGKEALNFQITVAIASVVSGFLTVVCIGAFLLVAVWIADLVFCIIASAKASSGQAYRYPVAIRFIK